MNKHLPVMQNRVSFPVLFLHNSLRRHPFLVFQASKVRTSSRVLLLWLQLQSQLQLWQATSSATCAISRPLPLLSCCSKVSYSVSKAFAIEDNWAYVCPYTAHSILPRMQLYDNDSLPIATSHRLFMTKISSVGVLVWGVGYA